MKIAYIAGFLAPVLSRLQEEARPLFEERSVVWIQQRSDRQPDINRLKADLFDQARRGATEILICVFVFREHEHVLGALERIAESATLRHVGMKVTVQRFFNGRDWNGILEILREFGPNRKPIVPSTLDDLESWALERWPSKLLLHPRALRGAKRSVFADVELIYAALSLLAEEYWNARTATPASAPGRARVLEGKLATLGLELEPSISTTRAGEEGDEYFVAYPVGGFLRHLLDLHLKKGSDREERNCLRIYFFWHEEDKIVVVGWLPSHLATRAT